MRNRGIVHRILVGLILPAGVSSAASAGVATTPTKAAGEPTTYCAVHITVSYWGALGAHDLRSSPVARVIANEILAKALEPGADLEAVGKWASKKYPDIFFGRTGPFSPGKIPAPMEKRIVSLKPGQIADSITHSDYGFHIIRRNETVRARHVLIAYKGAARATADRPREEARRRAEQVRAEAAKPGADFAALARKYSDARDGQWGGDVGVFDRGYLVKSFERAAFALKVGEVSPVIETRFGFHIIQRTE